LSIFNGQKIKNNPNLSEKIRVVELFKKLGTLFKGTILIGNGAITAVPLISLRSGNFKTGKNF
jgi:hypothetical protein